jgi:diguanylate cyclase (GGDEF)-like protein
MGNVVAFKREQDTNDRIKAALDVLPIAISWCRLDDGRLEFMNSEFINLFGYSPRQFPDVFGIVRTIHADAEVAEVELALLRELIGSVIADRIDVPAKEVLCRRVDGTTFVGRFSAVILPESNMALATFVDISDAKERERYLEKLATEDALTGLMNRRAFDQRLTALLPQQRRDDRLALLMIDLDGFKKVNDTIGHHAGDEVLRQFAAILRSSLRREDIACRWGGDEFAVILVTPCDATAVRQVADRVRKQLYRPLSIERQTVLIGASIGIAHYPDDAGTASDLYRLADERMFADKTRIRRGDA